MKNDVQLRADVEQELRWEPSVRAEQIGVSVKNGIVELDGHVDSFWEKWAAERATMRVGDARAVANEIKVELPASAVRTDEDIARTAVNQLEWNFSVPNTVKVTVTDGSLTLTGTTEWQYQKEEAERAVRPLRGMKWVCNDITVTPRVSAMDVKMKIEDALQRTSGNADHKVTVESCHGKVTLRGTVHTWSEREEAQHAAWAAPGVTDVEDLITIN